MAIVDETGDVKERYRYDAFGKAAVLNPDFMTKVTSDFDWDYLYTSRQLDKESGLQYSRFRYYHCGFGRFVNRDPIEHEAGDANLYRYVGNQAINDDDPLGLFQIGGGGQSGVPNVSPLGGDGTPPGIPNVSPLSGGGAPPGVPNVSPLGGGGTPPGVPNVSPVGDGGTPPGVPNANPVGSGGPGLTDGNASCPRPPYEQIDLTPYVWEFENNNNSTGHPVSDWLMRQGLRRGTLLFHSFDPTHEYRGRIGNPPNMNWEFNLPRSQPIRTSPSGWNTHIEGGTLRITRPPGRPRTPLPRGPFIPRGTNPNQ